MTSIVLLKDDDVLKGFEISGHSGYGTRGNDIVCASLSSVSWFTMELIADIALPESYTAVESNGMFYIDVNRDEVICKVELQRVLKMFLNYANEMEKKYPQHVIVLNHEGE